jgi:hypothetical protein
MPPARISRRFTCFLFPDRRAELFGCEPHLHLLVLFLGGIFKIIK